MTKRKIPKDPNRPKRWPTADYESGYARPPESGKIKPGEVRNPWGPKGKPKPQAIDPFEFAAAQPTKVTIDGKVVEVTAETAAQLVNMRAAMAGDTKAHKNMQDERRSRRRAGPPELTAEELLKAKEDEEKRKELSSKLIRMLDSDLRLKLHGVTIPDETGDALIIAPWALEAFSDYREKHGCSRELGDGIWSPHPEDKDDDPDCL